MIQLLFILQDDANLYIFLELVTKGSLASLYQIYVFTDSVVAAYTRQILSGLKYLHSRNIVHRYYSDSFDIVVVIYSVLSMNLNVTL